MAVHIIVDGANVSQSYGQPTYGLLQRLDHLIVGDRARGKKCVLVRSQLADHGDQVWRTSDISAAVELGYRDICIPLASRRVECKICHGHFTQFREKTVDAKIVALLYQTVHAVPDGDTIALVSGDADFFETVTDIQQTFDVRIEVWSFTRSASRRYQGQQGLAFHSLDALLQAV
jgi:hypothetical protein